MRNLSFVHSSMKSIKKEQMKIDKERIKMRINEEGVKMGKNDPVYIVEDIFKTGTEEPSMNEVWAGLIILLVLVIFSLVQDRATIDHGSDDTGVILFFGILIGVAIMIYHEGRCSEIKNRREKIKSIRQELVDFFQKLKPQNRISGYDYVELEKKIEKLKNGVEVTDDYTFKLTDAEAERLMRAFENLRKELQEKRLSGEL